MENSLSALTAPLAVQPNLSKSAGALLQPTDPEQSRLQQSCLSALQGGSIRAQLVADDVLTIAALQTQIEHCASAYCGAPSTPVETLKEATRFVENQFGHLTVLEIAEAFRMAASGRIEADLKAYHGVFSVRILGEVLAAYEDFRALTFRQVRAAWLEQQEAEQQTARAAGMIERFGTLGDQLQALRAKNHKFQTWQDVPLWFCRRCIQEGLIDLEVERKSALWISAKAWAIAQVETWLLDPLTSKSDRDRWRAGQIKNEDDSGCFPAELRTEAEAAYSQMLLFEIIAPYTEK